MLDATHVLESVNRTVDAVVRRAAASRIFPDATYRLQFHAGFTFRDATAIVPYLHALGISHIYAAPYTRAHTGSVHGYDVCDHNQLNPAIGDEDDYQAFLAALQQHGMGHIVDLVPNHMSAGTENLWWRDVLENGPNSPYSGFFDIDWKPVKAELENRVLIPILGEQYGDALENGRLQIDHADGGFQIRYYDRALPLGPKTTLPLLSHHLDTLRVQLGDESEALIEYQSILTAIEHLPPPTATNAKAVHERQREKEVIKRRLRELEAREPIVAEFVRENIAVFNGRPGESESFDRLDKLLQLQSYRLCHWRAASDEINYRRFFDVNDLVALCVEKPEVFYAVHGLMGHLLGEGKIDGLRIDHVDGLYAPEEYLWRLQWLYLAHVARYEFAEAAETPIESPAISVALAEETSAGATAEAGDAATATIAAVRPATTARTYPLGPEILQRVCRRLHLRQPGPADLAAIFGPTTTEARRWEMLESDSAAVSDATMANTETAECSPADVPSYVVVEKILGPDEPLPETWPVVGTTGYDYTPALNGLFIVPEGLAQIEKQYVQFTGATRSFTEIVHDCKRLILRFSMASELQMLAHRLNRISEQHRKTRDFTLNALRYALREVLANFPVYRTYPGPGGVSERDQRFVNRAVAIAKRRNPAMDPATFDFIRDVLLLRHPAGLSAEAIRSREEFTGRFQQVTSPTMAKGVEDTAFYVYSPLLSANEVGGDPRAATARVPDFHRQNMQRSLRQRRGLLATTTHDTKRSEDVRARVDVLSEVPKRWRKAVLQWSRLTRSYRQEVDGSPAPSREDEYLFYQSLIGVWPLEPLDASARGTLVERLQTYMEKATREAKQRTSWINPNAEYDQAVRKFVAECLQVGKGNKFLASFQAFQREIVAAGLYTALSQVILKLTSPGVPDIYQGQELWDFSLVDPDNRRPVDYDRRTALLEQVIAAWKLHPESRVELAAGLARTPHEERLKLFVTWRLLQLRREQAALFATGMYTPLECRGAAKEHVVAFAWTDESTARQLVVVVPRWWAKLGEAAGLDDVAEITTAAERVWSDTEIDLPAAGRFRNAFTDEPFVATSTTAKASDLLRRFPAAVLVTESEA
jgi:(1->4)-alpha-D-glucan 1-alpha-D-glucosylmutase